MSRSSGLVAVVVLFLAVGGTAVAGGKLLTGADIQDDSLTGADIAEPSLAKVPAASNADALGGTSASAFITRETAAGGDLTGIYPNPDIASKAVSAEELRSGAAAANVWGKDQWAPHTATERGYLYMEYDNVDGLFGDIDYVDSISYPVALGPGQVVESHFIRNGDETRVDGCGGTMAQPTAAPGHLCIFWAGDSGPNSLELRDLTGTFVDPAPGTYARYGRKLALDCEPFDECATAHADVVWAMTPPLPSRG